MRFVYLLLVLALGMAMGLSGCSDPESSTQANLSPVAFEKGDECHLCGMIIERFPGPKGQALSGKDQQVRKFCSTRDLMSWLLQPENRNRPLTVYVHDMAQVPWESPGDEHLIDARKAWYVAGSDRKGAMGPTLASFSGKAAAAEFAARHGGQVMDFDSISLETLSGSGH